MDQLVTTNTPVAHPACKFSTQLYSYLNSTAFSAIRWSESGRHVIVVDTDLLDSQLKAFGKPGELTMYSSLRRQFTGYHFTRSSATLLPAHEIPAGVHPTGKSCVWQHPDFTRTANNLSKRAGRVGTLVSCVAQSGSSNGLGKIADAGRTLVRRLTDKLTDKVESVWRSASSSSKPQSEPQSDDDVSDTSSSCSLVASEKEPLGYMFPPAVSHERSILPSIVAPCDLISPGHLGVPTAISSSAVSLNHVSLGQTLHSLSGSTQSFHEAGTTTHPPHSLHTGNLLVPQALDRLGQVSASQVSSLGSFPSTPSTSSLALQLISNLQLQVASQAATASHWRQEAQRLENAAALLRQRQQQLELQLQLAQCHYQSPPPQLPSHQAEQQQQQQHSQQHHHQQNQQQALPGNFEPVLPLRVATQSLPSLVPNNASAVQSPTSPLARDMAGFDPFGALLSQYPLPMPSHNAPISSTLGTSSPSSPSAAVPGSVPIDASLLQAILSHQGSTGVLPK